MVTTTDPVCGMKLEQPEAFASSRFEGRTYFFCSEVCKTRFETDPERYAFGAGTVEARP